MIWVTVLTTPARPQYLHDTLDRLDAAGAAAFRRIVFFDGQISGRRLYEIQHPGWELLKMLERCRAHVSELKTR